MKPKETIPTYIINLESRIERKNNVLNEFKGKDEFDIRIVEAIKHEVGAIGLWETIKHILNDLANKDEEYILICEDDHQFTSSYSKEILFHSIDEAIKEDADTLCGGIHWFNSAVEVSNNLFWVEFFTATQFIIVFRKFWEKILGADFGINDAADFKMSQLTNNKFVIYPFISTQKDYGYSDCTLQNNVEGRMKELFGSTSEGLGIVKKIFRHYRGEPTYFNSPKERSYKQSIENFENIVLPTYIIHFPERIENKEYIEKQFAGRTEFDITIVEAVKHETRQYSVWMTIRKIVQMAIDNDDDVIIICEDDHEFTEHYSKEYLLSNIVEAHEQGANYLSGGIGIFKYAVQVAMNRYWVSNVLGIRFIILYKNIFDKILNEPYDENINADILLSDLTSNKMILFPFISVQKKIDLSDANPSHHETKELSTHFFEESAQIMERIDKAYRKYQPF